MVPRGKIVEAMARSLLSRELLVADFYSHGTVVVTAVVEYRRGNRGESRNTFTATDIERLATSLVMHLHHELLLETNSVGEFFVRIFFRTPVHSNKGMN